MTDQLDTITGELTPTPSPSPIRRSDTVAKLAAALAKAQAGLENVTKEAKGNFGTYAELSAVTDAVRPVLSKEGIATFQAVTSSGQTIQVTTLLVHASGEYFESDTVLTVAKAAVWEQCGGFTYARRYALLAAVGLAPEDDDGQTAQGGDRPSQSRQAPQGGGYDRSTDQRPISEGQAKRLFAIAKSKDQDLDELRVYLRSRGWEHTTQIPRSAYDDIVAKIEAGTLPAAAPPPSDDWTSAEEIGQSVFPETS